MGEDDKQANAKRQPSVVAYAGLIAAVAGLISSWTAYMKARDERVAKDSYAVTTKAIERLSDESQMNHADIVALRRYLADHIEAQCSSPASSASPLPEIDARPPPIVITRSSPKTTLVAATTPAPMPTPLPPTSSSTKDPPPAKAPKASPQGPAVIPDKWPSD